MDQISHRLDGRVALITGASRGMGEAIATTFCDHGAHCVLASRKIDGLTEVVDKISARGGKATAIACHMGDLEQVNQMMEQIESKIGRLDIVVNNAATNPQTEDMLDASEQLWDKVMDVNLKGVFFLTQRATRLIMKGGHGGSIINIGSIDALRPHPVRGIYAISKAGLVSMTKALAQELAPYNIRVNAILPGLFDTYISHKLLTNKETYDKAMEVIPMARPAQPVEIAGAALYFASSASSYATGSVLVVDGGQVL